jgi:hypothetical protein
MNGLVGYTEVYMYVTNSLAGEIWKFSILASDLRVG